MGVTTSTANAGNTMVPIATQTLGSAAASVTFNSISGYTDLVLIAVGRSATASVSDSYLLTVNGDNAGTTYSRTRILGTGSAASSSNRTSAPNIDFEGLSGNSATSGVYSTSIINLPNYSNTSIYKTILIRGNDASNYVEATVGLWRNAAAITSINLAASSAANLMAGSTFTLYGIQAA